MKALVAPIHLDALLLTHDRVVRDALADYSRLPYTDRTRDHNSDTPYLADAILNPPFRDQNLLLCAGVHLHWSLPRGLSGTMGIRVIKRGDLDDLKPYFPPENTGSTEAWGSITQIIWESILLKSGWIKRLGPERASVFDPTHVDSQPFAEGMATLARQVVWTVDGPEVERLAAALRRLLTKPLGAEYPAVPDIWLVQRRKKEGTDRRFWPVEKTWIVESHYLATDRTETLDNLSAVSVPYHDDRHDNKSQPFRYMGRQFEGYADWVAPFRPQEPHLREVTAVGYNPQPDTKGFAEPTFAALYPNCMSVFGAYDPELPGTDDEWIYEVMGVYADPDNDYLNIFIEDFAALIVASATFGHLGRLPQASKPLTPWF